jgi:hypothetical protein
MLIITFAVLAALCGGAIVLTESRDRPRRRAARLEHATHNN